MKCPTCQRRLKIEATSCVCGWGRSAQARSVDCFNAPHCAKPAQVKLVELNISRNLCSDCYTAERTKSAEEFCRSKGMITREQKIAYCRELSGGLFKEIPVLREPGQDDEELAA